MQSMARELQPRNIHVAQVVIAAGLPTRSAPSVSPPATPTVVSTPTPSLRLISTCIASTAAHGLLTLSYGHGRKSFSTKVSDVVSPYRELNRSVNIRTAKL